MSDKPILDLQALLHPIGAGNPGGTDVSMSEVFDRIREARRADDTSLPQGEWQRQLKAAEWPLVAELTSKVLTESSKDLQAATWLAEALTHLHGFRGLAQGLELLTRLLDEFWDVVHPLGGDGEFDERTGKVAWLNKVIPDIIQFVPLTRGQPGKYGLLHWDEARTLQNLAARDRDAYLKALDDGKVTAEALEKAMRGSGAPFYADLYAALNEARDRFSEFERAVDARFGADAPSLKAMKDRLGDAHDLVKRLAVQTGAIAGNDAIGDKKPGERNEFPDAVMSAPGGPITNRAEALSRLREVADFFRRTEPHSPVAYLADKAAAWGAMSLDEWLRTVVKDQNVLSQLEETLGVMNPPRDAQPGDS